MWKDYRYRVYTVEPEWIHSEATLKMEYYYTEDFHRVPTHLFWHAWKGSSYRNESQSYIWIHCCICCESNKKLYMFGPNFTYAENKWYLCVLNKCKWRERKRIEGRERWMVNICLCLKILSTLVWVNSVLLFCSIILFNCLNIYHVKYFKLKY